MTPPSGQNKSGFVSIIGRPSVGKSTFLNAVCGHKVSIISKTPQTTRNKIRGIVTEPRGQLVFLDTPGYHHSQRDFNKRMTAVILSTFEDADEIVYMVDVTRPPGDEERAVAAAVAKFSGPVIAALNKIDAVADAADAGADAHRELIREVLPGAPVVQLSALTGEGVETLMDELFARAPEGEPYYPPEYYTDQEPQFRISEIIREKVVQATTQELPHAVYVEIADAEMVPGEEQNQEYLWVRGFICVERDSQKPIVIGKGGEGIRRIVDQAERECREIFPYDVELDLRVKVRPKWRRDNDIVRGLVY